MYRRRRNDRHQLVVPKALIYDVTKANYNPVYIAHTGMKRTFDLISLGYWRLGMRKCIQDYIRRYDPCQRRKEDRNRSPTRRGAGTNSPFPDHVYGHNRPIFDAPPRRNKYLLTFIDRFIKYAEAFPIPYQTAETNAKACATQIITRHGTGPTLITDQGRSFISSFFKET